MVAGNFVNFVKSTRARKDWVLTIGGASVWEDCDKFFQLIDARCGEGASSLFAEPTVKMRPDGGEMNVAWFCCYNDEPRSIDQLDRAMKARVLATLSTRLEMLRPALNDPEIGEKTAAMLNLFDEQSVMAVGEQPVLANWGILPATAVASQAAFITHTAETIGPFLPSGVVPRVPDSSLIYAQTDKSGRVTAATGSSADTSGSALPLERTQARDWWDGLLAPAIAAALLGLLLLYISIPGHLVYEKDAVVDANHSAEASAIEDGLKQRVEMLRTELGKDACAIDRSKISYPVFAPPNATTSPPSGGQMQSTGDNGTPQPPGRSAADARPAPTDTVAPSSEQNLTQILDNATVLVIAQADGDFSMGSGFFVSPTNVLTNRHVVEHASGAVYIVNKVLGAPQQVTIEAMSRDSTPGSADFALLKLGNAPANIRPLVLSSSIERLDRVVAGGFPAFVMEMDGVFQRVVKGDASVVSQLDMAVTQGNVIALPHAGEVQKIAHSASISPGNSGGPLVDACGRVVGINTFIISDREIPQKLNLSLSAQDAARFLASANVRVDVSNTRCQAEPEGKGSQPLSGVQQ